MIHCYLKGKQYLNACWWANIFIKEPKTSKASFLLSLEKGDIKTLVALLTERWSLSLNIIEVVVEKFVYFLPVKEILRFVKTCGFGATALLGLT